MFYVFAFPLLTKLQSFVTDSKIDGSQNHGGIMMLLRPVQCLTKPNKDK